MNQLTLNIGSLISGRGLLKQKRLSIVIPVYNEAATVHLILDMIQEVVLINDIEKELVIVNDCSTDQTAAAIRLYDPHGYNTLKPVMEGRSDAVFGSRFMGGQPHRISCLWHSTVNRLFTFLFKMVTELNLTNMKTGYNLFRTGIFKDSVLWRKCYGFSSVH